LLNTDNVFYLSYISILADFYSKSVVECQRQAAFFEQSVMNTIKWTHMNRPIYLDGFASLPLAPEARAAMLAAWDQPGNAGSPNGSGEQSARLVEDGRAAVAALIGAAAAEIVFTSGATEANNLAILGIAKTQGDRQPRRRTILVSAVEHKAVLEPAARLASLGFSVKHIPVHPTGQIDIERLRKFATDDVLLASMMLVNNETGVVQPVQEAAEIVHSVGGLFHCDAAQAVGKIPIDVLDLDVDYLSLSSHKCYGPMGIGALFVAATAPKPTPLLFGGGQQGAIRPGTEPAPLIAGFAAAAKAAIIHLERDAEEGRRKIARLLDGLRAGQVRFEIISGDAETVPGGVAIVMPNVDADMLCAALARDVSISAGSACNSGQIRQSHVLEAIGFSNADAQSVIRLYCNRYTTDPEIDGAAHLISDAVTRCSLATGELHQ
jgi:cysteine desulfurase